METVHPSAPVALAAHDGGRSVLSTSAGCCRGGRRLCDAGGNSGARAERDRVAGGSAMLGVISGRSELA